MKFNKEVTSFGRHETFPLRYGWLTKGFQQSRKNPKVFEDDDATVALGVGKNMVSSIKYWLSACCMVEKGSTKATAIGDYLLKAKGGKDPYLEDEGTMWLIHWLLATNAEQATTWFWFFNKFHKAEFSTEELSTALMDFLKDNISDRPAITTVKHDIGVLLRMYIQSRPHSKLPLEDTLDSPLASLRLVTQGSTSKTNNSRPMARPELPTGVFGFAVASLMNTLKRSAQPIEELMFSREGAAAPGAVFRLTENDLVTKLEQMVKYLPGKYEIRETAGISQVYQIAREVNPMDYLDKHYASVEAGVAA